VDCAQDEDEPPPVELRLAWMCERWNTLPKDGSLYGQDYKTMHRMLVMSNIYNTVQRFKHLQGKDIHKLTSAERKILRDLKDQGLLFHA